MTLPAKRFYYARHAHPVHHTRLHHFSVCKTYNDVQYRILIIDIFKLKCIVCDIVTGITLL